MTEGMSEGVMAAPLTAAQQRRCMGWSARAWLCVWRGVMQAIDDAGQGDWRCESALEVGAGVHSALAPLLLARAQRVECSALDAATLPVIEQRHAAMLAPEDAARISTSVQDVRALHGRWDCIVMKSVLGGLFRMSDVDGVAHMHALIARLRREHLTEGGWLISLDNGRTALEPLFAHFGARRNGWRFFAAGDFPPAQAACGFGALGAFSAATRLGAVGHAVDDALYTADCALSPLVRRHAVLGHGWKAGVE